MAKAGKIHSVRLFIEVLEKTCVKLKTGTLLSTAKIIKFVLCETVQPRQQQLSSCTSRYSYY